MLYGSPRYPRQFHAIFWTLLAVAVLAMHAGLATRLEAAAKPELVDRPGHCQGTGHGSRGMGVRRETLTAFVHVNDAGRYEVLRGRRERQQRGPQQRRDERKRRKEVQARISESMEDTLTGSEAVSRIGEHFGQLLTFFSVPSHLLLFLSAMFSSIC